METDEFVSSTSECYLMDTITISTAYLKMKNLCVSIRNEIQADIKIHNQHTIHGQHIFPRYLAGTAPFHTVNCAFQVAFQLLVHEITMRDYIYLFYYCIGEHYTYYHT